MTAHDDRRGGVDRDPNAPSDAVEPDGERVEGWPASLVGVTETVVATIGPNDRWNHAALGLEPAEELGGETADETAEANASDGSEDEHVEPWRDEVLAIARTWGRTRTRRNLDERGEAYVQFVRDPVDFVAAALDVHETDEPILKSADAWTLVDVEGRDCRQESDTEVVEWTLRPVAAAVRERTVPTTNRGRAAVIEATVAASRLDVDAYDSELLSERLEWLSSVVERCGSDRDAAALERIDELTGWRDR